MQPTRRSFMRSTAATLAVSPFLSALSRAQPIPAGPRKRILFFTKSADFQHSVITRPAHQPDQFSFAERNLSDLAKENAFDMVCSKDGGLFTPETLATFDGFVFYTTGDLTQPANRYATKNGPNNKPVPDHDHLLYTEAAMPPGGKEAFLDAIKNGKGFVGLHCASDTFHSRYYRKGNGNLLRDLKEGQDDFDPYIQMLGGEFVIHGKQQPSTLKCVDPNFPGAQAFDDLKFAEEWYSLKNFSPDLHVILAQDNTGMTGPMYQRKPFPETWARMHDKGRVFYSSMGHREDVWQKPEFQQLLLSALNWTTRRVDADVRPNLHEVTPDADVKA